MFELTPHRLFILPANCKINVATNEALKRPEESVYEPIVIRYPDGMHKLVGVLLLFMLQSQLLINQHNQALFNLMAGLKLTDDVAIEKFIQFAALPSNMDRKKLHSQYSIICMQCGQKISYCIADIVRSHPQLSKGIDIKNRMGHRFYMFYLRHKCGAQIIEIPVQHDGDFKFRSLRLPRLVDSYV
jgi:hypothetical protein